MMRKIYDYNDIRTLDESQVDNIHERIPSGLVITATSALRDEMQCYYENVFTVFGIHDVLKLVFPTINTRSLRAYTILRNILEGYIEDNVKDKTISSYLRRNSVEMLNAMKLLIETGARPDDLSDDMLKNEPLIHFKELWKKCEESAPAIINLKKQMEAPDLTELDSQVPAFRVNDNNKPELFLIGFYFITPLQDRLFVLLEEKGYRLNFLNCHNEQDAFETKIWEKTFPEYTNDPTTIISLQEYKLPNAFSAAIDNSHKEAGNIHVIKHHTDFAFAEMVKEAIDNGEPVYSPDATRCEEILREYYPERYANKHLLSYPVGQYIYYLHKMWDSEKNELADVRYDYVLHCFSSGWVEVNQNGQIINGREYLYCLKVLEPYFRNSRKPEDWKHQIDELKRACEETKRHDEEDTKRDIRRNHMNNVLRYVGVFEILIEEENMKKFCGLLQKLFKDAEYLFDFNEKNRTDKVVLKEHLEKIRELLHPRKDGERLSEDEEELVNSLINLIDGSDVEGIDCPVSGIRDAVLLLIDDRLGDYESHDEETEILDKMVLPMSMVEAATLANYGQKVHLVLADENTLPGKAKRLPWPLTDELVDKMQENTSISRYIKDMRQIITDRPLSYRYLFYSYIGIPCDDAHAELSMEWICEANDRVIDVSPYVRLLSLEDEDVKKNVLDLETAFDRDEVSSIGSEIPELDIKISKNDQNLCKRRFVYSYLMNEHPSFTSGFQYRFLVSALIRAFQDLYDKECEQARKEIKPFFTPFMGDMDFDSAADFVGLNDPWKDKYTFDGKENIMMKKSFAKVRVHYLNQKALYEMSKQERADIKGCVYCPYSMICVSSEKEKRDDR